MEDQEIKARENKRRIPMSSVSFNNSLVGFSPDAKSTPSQGVMSDRICIKKYTNLVKDPKNKQIELWLDRQGGLSASIGFYNKKGDLIKRLTHLRLEGLSAGLPKRIVSDKDRGILANYLENTHAIAEKGLDGTYGKVRVHISGKGGGRGKIPFQQGIALGSVVRGKSLEKMEKYAELMAKKQIFEEQINEADEQIELLEAKIATRKKAKEKGDDDPLIVNWQSQIKAIEACIVQLTKQMNPEGQKIEIPIFEGFQQALESPIDMVASHFETQPRGFDSLEYSSQYIKMDDDISEIHNKMTQSSSANSLSVGGGGGWGLWKVNAKASYSNTDAVAKRIIQIHKEKKSQGVLIINATVTTRHVRCFTHLKYDYSKLENILQAMKEGSEDELERYGITVDDSAQNTTSKKIYMLTEAVLGGSFTALVTFLDISKTTQDAEAKSEESSSTASASAKVGFALWNVGSGFSRFSSSASQSEDDVLKNIGRTKVNIEMFANGAIPTFARNIVEHEIYKHLDLNPSKFELTKKEESEVEAFIKAEGQDREIALAKQEMKIAKNQEAFLNQYRALTSEKDKQKIHTPESVMAAYEDFSKQITEDKDCGIPIGFNYRILTQANIEQLLKEHKASNSNSTAKKESPSVKENEKKESPSVKEDEGKDKAQDSKKKSPSIKENEGKDKAQGSKKGRTGLEDTHEMS